MLPRDQQYLSSYERGLIEFLEALPEEEAKVAKKVARKVRTKGISPKKATAEVAAEATA